MRFVGVDEKNEKPPRSLDSWGYSKCYFVLQTRGAQEALWGITYMAANPRGCSMWWVVKFEVTTKVPRKYTQNVPRCYPKISGAPCGYPTFGDLRAFVLRLRSVDHLGDPLSSLARLGADRRSNWMVSTFSAWTSMRSAGRGSLGWSLNHLRMFVGWVRSLSGDRRTAAFCAYHMASARVLVLMSSKPHSTSHLPNA